MYENSVGQLRYKVAGYIKALLRARLVQEPQFLDDGDRNRWGIANDVSEKLSCQTLLSLAEKLRGELQSQLLEGLDSVPVPAEDDDGVAQLIDDAISFVRGDLNETSQLAGRDDRIPWVELAHWENLPRIREALDKLPEPTRQTTSGDKRPLTSPSGRVKPLSPGVSPVATRPMAILFGPDDEPVVNGKRKPRLTPLRYQLIKRLIEARPGHCSRSQLERISTSYWRTLSKLRAADSDWAKVIHFPGKSHVGYWID